ncbi:hypothetical protein ANN_10669 [Periplaneta americana]|uniref:MULE transposase domain-containing protein n=1 Tax=Periplaneta americana TaxID=6978 RepID=A0ABQ8T4E4_PERAM|nr:hypothetical protein ANN_10669 [Periplaneta americana]
MAVISNMFPQAKLASCLFHLGQCFWRRLQSDGLVEEYNWEENVNLRSTFHLLIAIAFVPKEDASAFELLRDTILDNLVNLFDYVEHNYVRERRHGRGRQVPIFPPSTWNCYVRMLENLPRTTNTCEAWHQSLNTPIRKFHASFYHVLETLQAETAKIHNDIEKLEGGQSPLHKKKKDTDLDTRLSRIVERYQEYKADENVLGCLRAIEHGVAGHFG